MTPGQEPPDDNNHDSSTSPSSSTPASASGFADSLAGDFDQYASAVTSWIHPGHFFLVSSLPFCWTAYRGYYQTPLEQVVQNVLKARNVPITITELQKADDGIRKAVGSAVASRALRVATAASIGAFGLVTAGLFYASGCHSIEQAVTGTRQWAHQTRRRMDAFLGVENRVDQDHPEYLMTQSMSEEEELDFVSKTYLPDEDWEAEVETTSDEKDQ